MLIQNIVQALHAEIHRLETLRQAILPLRATMSYSFLVTSKIQDVTPNPSKRPFSGVIVEVHRPQRKHTRRVLVTSLPDAVPIQDASSVHGRIPVGAVVVPAEMARKQAEARRAAAIPVVREPTIEDAARSLADRWKSRA